MRNRLFIASLLAVVLGISGAGQQPTFPSRVELVSVDVVVFDRQGNPVEGLSRDDFTIREDGQAQPVSTFEAVSVQPSSATPQRRSRISTNDEQPDAAARWFFVVFDDVNITQFSTPRAREVVTQFIERVLQPGDHVMIAPASGGSTWTGQLPQDRDSLLAFVQRLQGERRPESGPGRIWDHEAMGIVLGRDPQAQAQVLRRYYENNILMEGAVTPTDAERRRELDVSPGVSLVQSKARQVYTEARSRLQVSLGKLERISAALTEARGRKSLLFFSEGFIADTTLVNFRTLVQTARNANVAINFVDITTPGAAQAARLPGGSAETGGIVEDRDAALSQALMQLEAEGARSIAADTGGTTVTGTNLIAGLARVANEGRAYYLLGYSPANTRRDGRFRKIEVTVNRPGVTVRARGGYFAPTNERETPAPSADTLAPDVRAALDSPFGAPGIPMRLTSYVGSAFAGGKAQTLLVAEADPTPLRLAARNGRYTATLESYVLVHDRSRDALERNERVVELNVPADAFKALAQNGIPLQREFSLAPGQYQATVLVRDRATGAIGSVRHEFDVPEPGTFAMTTPIVTDVVQAPAAAGQAPRPVPIARRTFKAGTRIAAAFDVTGAADKAPAGPQVSVSYALRRIDGTAVASAPAQSLKPNARGQFAVLLGIAIPAGTSGEHELLISVRDEQTIRVVEHVEPLTITP